MHQLFDQITRQNKVSFEVEYFHRNSKILEFAPINPFQTF